MRALITGGAGFIGSWLSEELIQRGFVVKILDDLSSGKKENLKNLDQYGNWEFIQGSILDRNLIAGLLDDVDICFHLAAALGVRKIIDEPLSSLEINLRGTETVVNEVVSKGKQLFLASTSEIYGKNNRQPLTENSDRVLGSPLLSRWSYSEAKAIDEFLVATHGQLSNLKFIIGRFFNTVGPRQTGAYGMVLPKFVQAALLNEPLEVYGDGSQTRVFCHVKDAVKAVVNLVQTPRAHGEAFNIGGFEETSIISLARQVIQSLNSDSEIVLIPFQRAFPQGFEETFRRVPDNSKLSSLTGWNPIISLDQIIYDTAEYFKNKIVK